VLDGGLIDFEGKADPEDEAYIATVRNRQQFVNTKVQAQPDWDKFMQDIPKNMSDTDLAAFLLEPKPGNILLNSIDKAADKKTMVIEVVSTPEYQLC
jgi:hypothetical protein